MFLALVKLSKAVHRGLEIWYAEGGGTLVRKAGRRIVRKVRPPRLAGGGGVMAPAAEWLQRFRPNAKLLQQFRETKWPADAPLFSIVMPVYNPTAQWLTEAVESVIAQTYPRWELLCVDDASPAAHVRPTLAALAARDARVKPIHLSKNAGVSTATNHGIAEAGGGYVLFMDHDDALEPHALHRFAAAVVDHKPDLMYADEAITGPTLDDVQVIRARTAFSYDHYLSHPYYVHPVAVRTSIARKAGGLRPDMNISHDVDFMLRLIEGSKSVAHLPDVLYRWRTLPSSLGHAKLEEVTAATTAAIARHLHRIGADATVHTRPDRFNVFDVRFAPPAGAKVAIVIPTRNQVGLLAGCVSSIERTVPAGLADVVIVDHLSDCPATKAYLAEAAKRHRVIPATGPFNFSALCNRGVAAVRGPYSHYLFLNNDTAAPLDGWLEHMLGLAGRPDVGCVGATLLYGTDTVQHAGVVVGLVRTADHEYRAWPLPRSSYRMPTYENIGLFCTRDYSAVTAACVLLPAPVFHKVGGFDEKLAVGLNDVDLCLRVKAAGYKVLLDANAVLYHHESQSRGTHDPHLADTREFVSRYRELLDAGDPYYSPLLSPADQHRSLHPTRTAPERLACRVVPVVLPARMMARAEAA